MLSVEGTIAGRTVSALYPAECYSIHLATIGPTTREDALRNALRGPNPNEQSYARFVVSSRYFHHAIRLLSPNQVNYVPYAACAEIVMNLAKALEILFSAPSRDALKERFITLGYTSDQIESQIVPILIVRNQIDVGHPSSGELACDEIAVLRKFVDRAVQNVASVLKLVRVRTIAEPDFLAALSTEPDRDRSKLIGRLKCSLESDPLEPGSTTPLVISCS